MNTWVLEDVYLTQAGSIYLELDYCGVIIGKNISIDNNNLIAGEKIILI